MAETDNRRPITARGSGWARRLAHVAADAGASPDLISAASLAFSVLGASLLLGAGAARPPPLRAALLVGAAAAIQLRLVCNLIDGLVAVEHRRGGSAGPIWNELPDRFSDVALLAAAGYSAATSGVALGVPAGWLCAVLALICAYLRELGRGLGFPADFSGPMAKPQRMVALTALCLVSTLEPLWGWRGQTLVIGLGLIALGAAVTVWRRTRTLARRLAGRARQEPSP
ncbi:MAG TPA: CDP-alcohol phosphatidyltransferase family protein [Caulobacteraceae bacterium]